MTNFPFRAGALLLALVLLSLLPEPLKGRFATSAHLHRLGHIAAFLFTFALLARPGRKHLAARVLLAASLTIVGIGLELLQTRIYGNHLEYWDIRDDAAGVAFGFLFLQVWPRPAQRKKIG